MHVLIAPEGFSGPLSAVEAAGAMACGWGRGPASTITTLPLSSGGTGLLDVIHSARGGRVVPVTVPGPAGRPVPAGLLHVEGRRGGTVYLDTSQVIGTHLVTPGDAGEVARSGTSLGVGELLRAALATEAGRLVIGCGPAATHDAGAGVLAVLARAGGAEAPAAWRDGARGLAAAQHRHAADPGDSVAQALAAAHESLRDREIIVAAELPTPLRGLHGAGAGLTGRGDITAIEAQDIDRVIGAFAETVLRHGPAVGRATLPVSGQRRSAWNGDDRADHAGHSHSTRHRVTGSGAVTRASGSGGGGGVAFALGALGARVIEGATVVAAEIDLARRVSEADVVLTGTAVLESTTVLGSALGVVSAEAMRVGIPTVVIAEEVRTSRRENAQLGISGSYELTPKGHGTAVAALEAFTERIARTWGRVA